MPKSKAEMMHALRIERAKKGLKRVEFYCTPAERTKLSAYLIKIRK